MLTTLVLLVALALSMGAIGAAATTTRKRGLYGTATFGSTVTATDVDAGAEVQNWNLRANFEKEDARGLADFGYVGMPTGSTWTFTCRKMIVTDGILTALKSGFNVMEVALYEGRAMTATTGTGSLAAYGTVIIDDYERSNDRGPVLVNVTGTFPGGVT